MTDALRAVLHTSYADVALMLDRPPSATPAELAEEVRGKLREWAAIHAHYFGPDVIDRAAELLAASGLRAAGSATRLLITCEEVMAWLHLAARS